MKRIFTTFAAGIIMSAAACSGGNSASSTSTDSANNQSDAAVTSDSTVLVAYFSATGTTKAVAERIAALTGGVLYEIKPETPYTDADLDWHDKNSRSTIEMADLSSRPAIIADLENADRYQTIYIGYPIWWYTAPTIVNTFIDTYKFDGKTVKPFATSGGSTIDKSAEDLKAAYPAINWEEGLLINGLSDDEINRWLK